MVTTNHAQEPARLSSAITTAITAAARRPAPRPGGREPGPRRLPWILGCLASAVWGGVFPLLSDLVPQRNWGFIATGGYLLAAAVAAFAPRRRAPALAVAVALAGAVLLPLAIMLASGQAQSEVYVVQNSATQLLHTGSPYLPSAHRVIQYNPYLPAMALFGLPRALLGTQGALPQILGDARLWFLLAFLGCLVATWRLLRTSGPARGWLALAAVTASPLVALPASVSGVDLPLIGCCLLGLACAGQGRLYRAALFVALACALKWTAWPAVPVALLLVHQRYGLRPALRCAALMLAASALLIVPCVLATPGAVLEQVVRFPLGLSKLRTPANSPLPGHLLAELGPDGRIASLVLLGAGGAAIALWLLLRPPHTVTQAADRLAAGVAVAFLLAPAGRFGYLELPVLLVLWPRLALGRRAPAAAEPGPAALRELRAVPVVASEPVSGPLAGPVTEPASEPPVPVEARPVPPVPAEALLRPLFQRAEAAAGAAAADAVVDAAVEAAVAAVEAAVDAAVDALAADPARTG